MNLLKKKKQNAHTIKTNRSTFFFPYIFLAFQLSYNKQNQWQLTTDNKIHRQALQKPQNLLK